MVKRSAKDEPAKAKPQQAPHTPRVHMWPVHDCLARQSPVEVLRLSASQSRNYGGEQGVE